MRHVGGGTLHKQAGRRRKRDGAGQSGTQADSEAQSPMRAVRSGETVRHKTPNKSPDGIPDSAFLGGPAPRFWSASGFRMQLIAGIKKTGFWGAGTVSYTRGRRCFGRSAAGRTISYELCGESQCSSLVKRVKPKTLQSASPSTTLATRALQGLRGADSPNRSMSFVAKYDALCKVFGFTNSVTMPEAAAADAGAGAAGPVDDAAMEVDEA